MRCGKEFYEIKRLIIQYQANIYIKYVAENGYLINENDDIYIKLMKLYNLNFWWNIWCLRSESIRLWWNQWWCKAIRFDIPFSKSQKKLLWLNYFRDISASANSVYTTKIQSFVDIVFTGCAKRYGKYITSLIISSIFWGQCFFCKVC